MSAKKIEYLMGPATNWVEPEHEHKGQIRGATLQNRDTIVLNIDCNGIYSVRLQRHAGNHFLGNWSYPQGSSVIQGHAEGRLYKGENGYLLFGKWNEENTDYYWWTELFVTDPPKDD